MIKNVCVFASSSNKLDEEFYSDASELGQLLGAHGMNIVYGGSRLGAMYACASSVGNAGGNIIGVMPQRLYDLGVGNPEDCSEFYLTEGMRERKAKMDELSDAVIALAGGFDTNNFYGNLINFFQDIIDNNFAKKETENLYYVANSPAEAVNYLMNYKASEICYSGKF